MPIYGRIRGFVPATIANGLATRAVYMSGVWTINVELDDFSTSIGALISRGPTNWGAIEPGALDQVLTSNGFGQLPSYRSLTAGAIPDGTLPLAKLADISTDRLLGRDTAGSGPVEELTVSGGLEFTGAGGIQRSALTGDVVAAAGSGVTVIQPNAVGTAEIADGSVTYVKMQDVSSIQRVLGRSTGGVSPPLELTIHDILNWLSGTQGAIIFRDAGGSWNSLPPGSAGQFLQTQGGGANPLWASPPGAWTLTTVTASDAAWPVPPGTIEIIIEAAGAGGSGGNQSGGTQRGGGGGGGSRLLKVYNGTMDATLNIQIGAGGTAGGNGGATTVTGTNLGTLTAPGGNGGGVLQGGAGGATPTGGDFNDPGGGGYTVSGGGASGVGYGGDCPMGGYGGKTNVGNPGNTPGGGGAGENHTGGGPGAGARGEVRIWTR